jgi:hypothetical protein
MAGAIRISELDFNSIRENLKNYLKSQTEFTDYDFDGSGLSILLDILAYNTHYNAYYLNMIGNEMFLDTAQIRNSVLSLAKLTNYVPRSRTGAVATVDVVVTPPIGDTESALVLPQFTRFISEPIDGVNYVFSTTESAIASKISSTFTFNNIEIKQGETSNLYYTVSNSNRRYSLPSANADTSTITVSVQESSSNTYTTKYTLAQDLTEVTANSTVFFVEESSDQNYTLYFGDNVLGKQPSNGNIIIIKYLDTMGSESNKANSFSSVGSIGGYSNISVVSVSSAAAGADKETVEQIRYRAPIHYTTQNRAVTKTDFESLLMKDYPNISSISIWSGDENDPPVYGKVFISLKPVGNYEFTTTEKERIISDIISNRSTLTVFPEIIDPDFTYMLLRVTVAWKPSLTDLNEYQISSLVRTSIEDYVTENLSAFGSVYRNSVLHNYIDRAHQSILSSEVTTFLQKRVTLVPKSVQNYTINFATSLHRGGLIEGLYSYPAVKTYDINQIERNVYFEEVSGSFTGLDSIKVIDPGRGYLVEPTVTITGDGTGAKAIARIVNGKVNSIELTSRGTGYTRATAAITGGGGSGSTAQPSLQFRNGTIRTYYFKDNGEKVIVNSNAGTIDYDLGKIILKNFYTISTEENDIYDTNILTINIKPEDDIVRQARNGIIDVDLADTKAIQINVDPE